MKKLICLYVLLTSFLFPCFSYSSKKYVKCYGNEPFVYLGINTKDEVFYKVVASEEIIQELFDRQGEVLKFYGTLLQNSNENTLLFEVQKVDNK